MNSERFLEIPKDEPKTHVQIEKYHFSDGEAPKGHSAIIRCRYEKKENLLKRWVAPDEDGARNPTKIIAKSKDEMQTVLKSVFEHYQVDLDSLNSIVLMGKRKPTTYQDCSSYFAIRDDMECALLELMMCSFEETMTNHMDVLERVCGETVKAAAPEGAQALMKFASAYWQKGGLPNRLRRTDLITVLLQPPNESCWTSEPTLLLIQQLDHFFRNVAEAASNAFIEDDTTFFHGCIGQNNTLWGKEARTLAKVVCLSMLYTWKMGHFCHHSVAVWLSVALEAPYSHHFEKLPHDQEAVARDILHAISARFSRYDGPIVANTVNAPPEQNGSDMLQFPKNFNDMVEWQITFANEASKFWANKSRKTKRFAPQEDVDRQEPKQPNLPKKQWNKK